MKIKPKPKKGSNKRTNKWRRRGQLFTELLDYVNSKYDPKRRKAAFGKSIELKTRLERVVKNVEVLPSRFFLYSSLLTNISHTFDKEASLWTEHREIWNTASNSLGGRVIRELSDNLYNDRLHCSMTYREPSRTCFKSRTNKTKFS